MGKPITIWQLGNTGLRNPMRIWEGLKLFAESPFNGNLRGSNEERFQTLLNHAGLVNSTGEAEDTSSYARKWRLMFARFGFIYPQVKKKDGKQEDLGPPRSGDTIRRDLPQSRHLSCTAGMLLTFAES